MGLRSDVQTELAAAMGGDLIDVVEDFQAARTTVSDDLDPVTGTYPETTETFIGRWIRDTWSRQELDSQHIEATDIKRIILQNETPWTPAVDDVANDYRVADVQQDGAEATWILQLRRS